MLRNPGFESDWSEEGSHKCRVFPIGGSPYDAQIGNIFTPPSWTVFFRQGGPLDFAQPEVRDARATDPRRWRTGTKGTLLFTFNRRHDAGLMQQIQVGKGSNARFTAYAHAWSNHKDTSRPQDFPHPDDPFWSEGAGFEVVAWKESSQPWDTGDPQQDAKANFTFLVGIDPTGALDPYAETVIWSDGWHIYNGFARELDVTTVAEEDVITVFLRSITLWPFKHNDAYWDDCDLTITAPEPECRGKPRIQYKRTYVLIHGEKHGKEWPKAVHDATWSDKGYTVGQSGDDAGLGDLDERTVIAVNAGDWSSDGNPQKLADFFQAHYPGVDYQTIEAATPEDLRRILAGEQNPQDPPPLPRPGTVLGQHLQTTVPGWLDYVKIVRPGLVKLVGNFELAGQIKAASPGTQVAIRHHLDHQDPYLYAKDKRQAARDFLAHFAPALETNNLADHVDYALELNEYIGTGTDLARQHGVEWMIAFNEELKARFGDAVRPGNASIPVGNPQHGKETEDLIPAARSCADRGGLWFYHGYWMPGKLFAADHDYPKHYHLRNLFSHDPVFVAAGIYVKHAFGELGVVGVKPDGSLEAAAGWKDPLAYNGDWTRYKSDLLGFARLVDGWNNTHGNRCRGGVIFTSGIGTKWDSFQIRTAEWQDLSKVE